MGTIYRRAVSAGVVFVFSASCTEHNQCSGDQGLCVRHAFARAPQAAVPPGNVFCPDQFNLISRDTQADATTIAASSESLVGGMSGNSRISDRKAKGLFDGDSFHYVDSRPEGSRPLYYNVRVTKSKGVYGDYGRSGMLNSDDYRCLRELVRMRLTDLSEGIIAGHIDIKPYRLGGKSPCSGCDYRSLCRFDWHTNDYNFLDTIKKTDVLKSV